MSKNKALWERICTTDPRAVKPITGKPYTGNSPKPYWIVERLTEEFGPCGKGWGFTILSERFERFSDTDSLHVAVVEFWYMLDGDRCQLQQIGQTKASYMSSKGAFILDEDAPKKSVTDALVKCASYIGFAGDIFSGRWDDSKYVAEAKRHYEEVERSNPARDLAALMIDDFQQNREGWEWRAYEEASALGNGAKMALWRELKEFSKIRSTIKRLDQEQRERAAELEKMPAASEAVG